MSWNVSGISTLFSGTPYKEFNINTPVHITVDLSTFALKDYAPNNILIKRHSVLESGKLNGRYRMAIYPNDSNGRPSIGSPNEEQACTMCWGYSFYPIEASDNPFEITTTTFDSNTYLQYVQGFVFTIVPDSGYDVFPERGGHNSMLAIEGAPNTISIDSNVPIFSNMKSAFDWLRTGNDEYFVDVLNNGNAQEIKEKHLWFIESVLMGNNAPTTNGGIALEKHRTSITCEYDSNGNPITKVVGYISPNSPYNIMLVTNNENFTCQQTSISHSDTSIGTIPLNPWHTYTNIIRGDSDYQYYYGNIIDSNIPIVYDEKSVIDYFNNIDVEFLSNGFDNTNYEIGIDAEFEQNTTSSNSGSATTFVISKNAFKEFRNFIYGDSGTITQLIEGLKMFGDNPLNTVISAFYLPINPLIWGTSTEHNDITFGNYTKNGFTHIWNKIETNNNLVTVFSQYVKPNTDDFRSYYTNYYLYLPYVGIQNIETSKILNTYLECKCFMDIRTGTIKYWLYSNGALINDFTGSVNISLPLTASNISEWATNLINNGTQVLNSGLDTYTKAKSGNIIGTVQGAENVAGALYNLAKPPKKLVSGNSSPSASVLDPTSIYLIIETPNIIYDSKIRNTYNLPDNSIGTLNSYRGFIKCDNVNLKSGYTKSEIDEAIQLLTSGVFI